MNIYKRALRWLFLGLLILLALMGLPITGAVFFNKKERDYENEIIKTELAEGHEEAIQEIDKHKLK
jgi:hypothetical protein